MSKRILVTGGTGYIGSHTVVALVEAGYEVLVLDNLSNSSPESLKRVAKITGKPEAVEFKQVDVRDYAALDSALASSGGGFIGLIHFAALKAVGESVAKPLAYYENNIGGLVNILKACVAHDIKRVVFSSSATVYGTGSPPPFTEDSPTGVGVTNPYGQTKYMAETILKDFQAANPSYSVLALRYFNPVGAHESGLIGEDPAGLPNNLMPYIQRVAVGKLPQLQVHGGDYATPDGTAQRDYIHVVDLADGHLKALAWLAKQGAAAASAGAGAEEGASAAAAGGGASSPAGLYEVINLGTGNRLSVLDVVSAYQKAAGVPIKYSIGPRRAGDLPAVWAEPTKAKAVLGWEAKLGVDRMCEDSWRWISSNPDGYRTGGK